MAYTCSTCGEQTQSEGARRLHDLVAHFSPAPEAVPAAGSAVPPPPPPPGPPGWPPPGQGRAPSAGSTLGPALLAIAVCALFVAGVAAALHVGRSPSTTTVAAEEVGAPLDEVAEPASSAVGPRTVSRPDEGFAIGVPDGMTELPLSRDAVAEMADVADSLNPAVARLLRSDGDLADTVRFFAIDQVSGRAMLVQKVRAGGGADIGDVPRGTFSEQYRRMGAVSTDEARVEIPAGDAILVSVSLPMGGTTVPVTQYILVNDGWAWILTSSAPGGDNDAAAIANTFRFV